MARPEMHYHRVPAELAERMTEVRRLYIHLSEFLDTLPPGRSISLAQTHLEDSCMRAIQSIAMLGEKLEPGDI